MKILTVVGTRPNFIKLSSLDRELRKDHTCITVHTGQHFDDNMSGAFFREFGIAMPNYDMNISNPFGDETHATQTGQMMIAIDKVIAKESPDLVLVYGDTNSTLAGALVAAKRNIPVGHIEAGCRSWDMTMPEEVNRVIVDSISTLLFCPTTTARANLNAIWCGDTYNTGDVMVDSLEENILRARDESNILNTLDLLYPKEYAVLTLHRPSNVDSPARLMTILNSIDRSGVPTIFPIHPRTRKIVGTSNLSHFRNITITNPIAYRDMLLLMDRAKVVVTDSGGIQKEAFILKKPCLTIRNNTEWPETLQFGWNALVKDLDKLPDLIHEAKPPLARPDPEPFLPGASRRIAKLITVWGQR